MKVVEIVLNNFWPKFLALVLAIATWFYVFDVINVDPRKKETAEDVFARSDIVVKEVKVKPVFTGRSPRGYKVAYEKVKITPPGISIIGPESLLKDLEDVKTQKIDLSEYTRSVRLKLGIVTDIMNLPIEDKVVDVFLPVERIKSGNDSGDTP